MRIVMKNKLVFLALATAFSGAAFATSGPNLINLNRAVFIVKKSHAIQQKYQGPDAAPVALQAPTPRADGQGQFVSPYTAAGQLTAWAQTGMSATTAGVVGGEVGKVAATTAAVTVISRAPGLASVPGSGVLMGMFSKKAAKEVEEASPIVLMGGWDSIRGGSDQSFDSLDDLAVFMHAKHLNHPDYSSALAATIALYPELDARYEPAVEAAVKLAAANHQPATTAIPSLSAEAPHPVEPAVAGDVPVNTQGQP